MRSVEISINSALVQLSVDDVALLNNALNEVCNGVYIDDAEFSTRLGMPREESRALLQQINSLLKEMADREQT